MHSALILWRGRPSCQLLGHTPQPCMTLALARISLALFHKTVEKPLITTSNHSGNSLGTPGQNL